MINFVWAEDSNGLIGNNGVLPWYLPNDLQFFKKTTLNHTIVMGRKTFEGMNKKLLPQRQTVILTTNAEYDGNGAQILPVSTILEMSKKEEVYIVGGAQVFETFLPYVDKLYQTKIVHVFEGDAYMPKIPYDQFEKIEVIEGIKDEKNKYDHTFNIYVKKENASSVL